MNVIPLRTMQAEQSGIIQRVQAKDELGRRIRDMGLIPGTCITLVGRAPLRDPVALKLNQAILTLRNKEADTIWVTVE